MSYTLLYEHESVRRPLQIGDMLDGYPVSAIGVDFFEVDNVRRYFDAESVACYTFAHSRVIAVRNSCYAHFFDRVTGHLLLAGRSTSSGRYVHGVFHECIVLDSPDGEREILFWEASKRMMDAGVEARCGATVTEFCGLPRENGCVPVGDELVPLNEAVWFETGYRRISELFIDGSCIGRFIAPNRPNYTLTSTGLMCPTDDIIRLGDGRTASPFETVRLRNGDCALASEAYLIHTDIYSSHWSSSVPEGYELFMHNGVAAYWSSGMVVTVEDTGERALRYDAAEFEGRWYSHTWANDNLRRCEECGAFHRNTTTNYCGPCMTASRTRVRGYSNRASSYMAPEKDVPIKFGIELEVGCDRGVSRQTCVEYVADAFDRVTDSVNYVTYKEDGSICDVNGFEIVTRPDCPSVHKRVWSEVLSDTRVLGSITSWRSGKCGMHIHVSRKPLSELWVGRIMVLVNADAFAGLLRSVAGRGSNGYSQVKPKKFGDVKRGSSRYDAINISGDHTIEFRMFRGTTLLSSFLKNIEFVEAVLDYCRPHARSLQVIGDPQDFLSYVGEQRKRFSNLFGFLKQKGWYDS